MMMASELEFYLFRESYENIHDKGYRHLQAAGHYNEDYNLLQGTRNESLYRKIRNDMTAAGIRLNLLKVKRQSDSTRLISYMRMPSLLPISMHC